MTDLEFFNSKTRRKLNYDEDGDYFIVEQYQEWFVRSRKGDNISPGIIADNGERVGLEWSEGYKGWTRPLESYNHIFKASSGLLDLYDISSSADNFRKLHPPLYIGPRNLSEKDYAEILDRLGQLAIAQECGLLAPVTVASHEGIQGVNNFYHDEYSFVGENLLKLAKVIQENWNILKEKPSKEIRYLPETIDMTKPRSSYTMSAIYRAVQKPHLRRQLSLTPKEHFDTFENRLLVFILKFILLNKSDDVASLLREKASWYRSYYQSRPTERHRYEILWNERQVSVGKLADHLDRAADHIHKNKNSIKYYLNEPFLKGVEGKLVNQTQSYSKIQSSKEYGQIYKAYQEYLTTQRDGVAQTSKLYLALKEKAIKPVSNLYEMWAFIEIYSILVRNFNFIPKGKSPLDAVQINDGEIDLEAGSAFDLIFTPKNLGAQEPKCEIKLEYTPKVKPNSCQSGKPCYSKICKSLFCYQEINQTKNWADKLTPDILITVKNYKDRIVKKFVIDIKYRNYLDQMFSFKETRKKYNVDTVFNLDLFGTAKMKYLDGLGVDAAFILHSDPGTQYTTFGDQPFQKRPLRERLLDEDYFPAHKVGAVFASPSNLSHLEKLLRCFLMYHCDLSDICWSCGNLLTEQNGGLKKHAVWKGDYFQCPDCGRFWIRSVCQNAHTLIKLGKDSFHKLKADNEWQCICPVCGDEFKAERDYFY